MAPLAHALDRRTPAGRRSLSAVVVFGVVPLALLGLTSCGDSQSSTTAAGTVSVVTSFYPLQFVAEQVGGDRVSVTDLAKPGVEPHDLELAPRDVAALVDSDLTVYLSGFQPAVDDALDLEPQVNQLDVSQAADLSLSYLPSESEGTSSADTPQTDPHFWLDPKRLADVGDAVAASLGALDPKAADAYTANADQLRRRLARLDTAYRRGLNSCEHTDIVTSHKAFGYLAEAYGLTQVGVTGLIPDTEPTPADLAAVIDFVEHHHVPTVFYEPLAGPAIAQAIASATGATTAVLDPIETISDQSQGDNYLQVMRSNLTSLRTGLVCS